jgi:hypothetical protein
MNPFLLSATERLTDWRQFRTALVAMPEDQRWAAVATYWAKAPLSITADPACWPTIWQMFQVNQWSRNAVAIGMEATLRLIGISPDRLTLSLILDCVIKPSLMVLVIDDAVVLNYDWGFPRAYSANYQILNQWRYTGKDYSTLGG